MREKKMELSCLKHNKTCETYRIVTFYSFLDQQENPTLSFSTPIIKLSAFYHTG